MVDVGHLIVSVVSAGHQHATPPQPEALGKRERRRFQRDEANRRGARTACSARHDPVPDAAALHLRVQWRRPKPGDDLCVQRRRASKANDSARTADPEQAEALGGLALEPCFALLAFQVPVSGLEVERGLVACWWLRSCRVCERACACACACVGVGVG